jgi:ribosomal protein S18 acetylase RimI-like enzyme
VITLDPLDAAGVAAWREGLEDRLVATRVRAGIPEAVAVDGVHRMVAAELADGPPEGTLLLRARRDGAALGVVWVSPIRPGVVALTELAVPPPDAVETVAALLDLLRERGIEALELTAATGDEGAEAVVGHFDPELVATHMQLALAEAQAAAPAARVRLARMDEDDFAAYQEAGVRHYGDELFGAGDFATLDEARHQAVREFASFFPLGLESPGQHLWTAYDGSTRVGVLWICVEGAWAFIYDIEMAPEARGQGYGTEVLTLGAAEARARGATHLGLNVFGHNAGAQRLYSRTGFVVTRRFHRLRA